jgi:hypothetical protein
MANFIEQYPKFSPFPVGQEVIYSVSNVNQITVVGLFNVKFIANVYISETPITWSAVDYVGSFKTTPNAAGVGMFDFTSIIEAFVSADNLGATNSQYKTTQSTNDRPNPLHLIDKFSTNDNVLRYLAISFDIEGSTTIDGVIEIIQGQQTNASQQSFFNGYLKYSDSLVSVSGNFGYSLQRFNIGSVTSKFLTNAPTTQYANIEDYGTFSFLSNATDGDDRIDRIAFKYYNSSGGAIAAETVDNDIANGGYLYWDSYSKNQILHFGCFPANLRNWSTTFQTAIGLDLSYYTVRLLNALNADITETYTININCPTLKGYEPIRLTWLNQWGVWDYYTFTMLSSKTTSTKGSTYQQLGGTWNKTKYQMNGYKGGKKAFRVNATEKIKMNTDFVSEAESEWFEELINSPEVYILEGFQTDPSYTLLNTYATPVRLTTSNYTKKTVANDKLMQYTFEVEKSKTLRTQAI